MMAASEPYEHLFASISTLDTRSEDLQCDLESLHERLSKERLTHQTLLEAKNDMIDALYFKSCRLEYGSKKALNILTGLHQRLTNFDATASAPLDPLKTIALALRYLEVSQSAVEEELDEESTTPTDPKAQVHLLLDTYESDDETETPAAQPNASTATVAITLYPAKQTPTKAAPLSHPPTPESLVRASPASSVLTGRSRGRSLSLSTTQGTPERTPLAVSHWTPSISSPLADDPTSPTHDGWTIDTPCKSRLRPRELPNVSCASFTTPSPRPLVGRTGSRTTLSAPATPCNQCRRSEDLLNTWQEERETLRWGMEDLAYQIEAAHGQVAAGESYCRGVLERLSPIHRNLKQHMASSQLLTGEASMGALLDLQPPGAQSISTDATSSAGLDSTLTGTVVSSTGFPEESQRTTRLLLDDLTAWVNILQQQSTIDLVRSPQRSLSVRSMNASNLTTTSGLRSPDYSLVVSPLQTTDFTYSLTSSDYPASPTRGPDQPTGGLASVLQTSLDRDSMIDPLGAAETLAHLDRLFVREAMQSGRKHAPVTAAEAATAALEGCPASPAPPTVHLDAITYTDFASFTLGLATYGAKRALTADPLLPAAGPDGHHWNQLPLAYHIMEDDVKPCLMFPNTSSRTRLGASQLPDDGGQTSANSRAGSSRLVKEDLLEAILNQRCEMVARSLPTGPAPRRQRISVTGPAPQGSSATPTARDSALPTQKATGDAIVLRGPSKRRVSILDVQDQYIQTDTVKPSTTACCALCGQERECEYTLTLPRSDPVAQSRLFPVNGALTANHPISTAHPGSGTLSRSWKMLTSELRWGRKSRSVAPNDHATHQTTAPPTTAYYVSNRTMHHTELHATVDTSNPTSATISYPIDRFCRDRVVTVCDFVGFLSHLARGLWDHVPLLDRYEKFMWHRQRINWARLGCLSMYEPEPVTVERPPAWDITSSGYASRHQSRIIPQPLRDLRHSRSAHFAGPAMTGFQRPVSFGTRGTMGRPPLMPEGSLDPRRSGLGPLRRGSAFTGEETGVQPRPITLEPTHLSAWKRARLNDCNVVLVR
ncbi:hypothetical protein IWQ60_008403 [Tieghemiomyces parasiticus]|uniref:Uncharacterized protein n=1 Tax=Tieghemiomyces parasiticus TaxID=78921 RepID=A0A9W7ZS84_9FUNG|nr:hypothetical protein IWQ60_008403 [Tieghemiomyces parasiticus]